MIRILNAEPYDYSPVAREILQQVGEVVEEDTDQTSLRRKVCTFDVVIVRLGLRVTREVMEAPSQVKVVVTATTGVDHIDTNAAEKLGITVLSLRGEYEFLKTIPATAEHTWGLLLALMRRIPWAFDHVRGGGWDRASFRGQDLSGKRLGILGLGRVGEQVARFGVSFGMDVGAYDPLREQWPQGVWRYEAVEDLLRESEILTVHLPLREETRGFLSADRLRLLPFGARVINTSRGAVLDEQALVSLLEDHHLTGAAVDVVSCEQFEDERKVNCLIQYASRSSNLIVTPHIAGATIDSMQRTEIFMAEKLRRFLAGNSLGTDRTRSM